MTTEKNNEIKGDGQISVQLIVGAIAFIAIVILLFCPIGENELAGTENTQHILVLSSEGINIYVSIDNSLTLGEAWEFVNNSPWKFKVHYRNPLYESPALLAMEKFKQICIKPCPERNEIIIKPMR